MMLGQEMVVKGESRRGGDRVDVFLVICPPWGVYMPPIGPAYLSTYLRSRGVSTRVLDINIELYNGVGENLKEYWHDMYKENWAKPGLFPTFVKNFQQHIERFADEILSFNPRVVGFSLYQENIQSSLEVMKKLRGRGYAGIIVVGGPSTINFRERNIIPKDLVDFIVVGDGEKTLYEIAIAVMDGVNDEILERVSGVMKPGGQDYARIDSWEKLNPNDIPFPTYEEFDLDSYCRLEGYSTMISLLMSKGCNGNCVFCNDRVLMGKFRIKEPENVLKEIRYHVENHNTNNFVFNDLTINGDMSNLNRFCDLVIQEGIQIRWIANAIPKRSMDKHILEKMKAAGCHTLTYGIESGSNDVLKKMRKIFTVQDAETVLKDTKDAGINNWINLIVGFPGEGREEFEETLDFVRRNRYFIDRVCIANTCNVVYCSELMENRKKYGIMLPDNHEADEIEWFTEDGNTDEMRKGRLKTLLDLLEELGIDRMQDNLLLFDERHRWRG